MIKLMRHLRIAFHNFPDIFPINFTYKLGLNLEIFKIKISLDIAE